MKIGFVGLGVMGRNMASNLVRAGYEVTVSDLVQPAVDELVALGAKEEKVGAVLASQQDIIFTSLPNSAIVEAVILGKNGILEGAKEGTIIIDLSSITPKTVTNMAKKALAKGVKLMDSPVSGGEAGAKQGTLTLMVGGDTEDFEKVLPVLGAIGKNIKHVGPAGAGATIKLVNNLLLGVNMVAVAEAMALGKKAGIETQTMYNIISESSGSSYALKAKYDNFIAKRNFDPGFMIDLQYKDLQLAVDTAKDLQMPLMLGNVAQQTYEIARAMGMGREDISAVLKIYEQYGDIEV